MSEVNKVQQRELEQAWRNARGADHAGRYDVADWWESRARDLEEDDGE